MAVSGPRQHGSNDGYDDNAASYYSWDSSVPNHAQLSPGDIIALWDKKALLGVSRIERISVGQKSKTTYQCDLCGSSNIKQRLTGVRNYRCHECGGEFDKPREKVREVSTYKSEHGGDWVDLSGRMGAGRLRQLCVSPKSQLSLRPLQWDSFVQALSATGVSRGLLDGLAALDLGPGGHAVRQVRVRVGQASFRRRLLERWGSSCAISGSGPESVIDACHLYSYAQIGVHRAHGGVLLRKDLHALFDHGLLAIDPLSLAVDLSPSIRHFAAYSALHSVPLKVDASEEMRSWFQRHWTLHRPCEREYEPGQAERR